MRVKAGTNVRRKHKKVLNRARGFWGRRSKTFRAANEAVMHAGMYAWEHRRTRKRDFRRLWVQRINAASREHNVTYSQFMNGLKRAGVGLDRKALAHLAIDDRDAFAKIVAVAQAALKPA